jgi:hypothetical protein
VKRVLFVITKRVWSVSHAIRAKKVCSKEPRNALLASLAIIRRIKTIQNVLNARTVILALFQVEIYAQFVQRDFSVHVRVARLAYVLKMLYVPKEALHSSNAKHHSTTWTTRKIELAVNRQISFS